MTLSSSTSAATLYHVSLTGSDSASGSEKHPWLTLQHAADRVAPGDTVLVHPGRYMGFELRTSGTPEKPITFAAQLEVGAQPGAGVIDRPNPITGRDGIYLHHVSYVTIDGFTIQGDANPRTTRAGILTVGDGNVRPHGHARGIVLRRNVITDWGKWGILTGYHQDLTIEDNQTSGSIREHGIYVANSTRRVIVRRNRVFNNASCGIHFNGDRHCGNPGLPEIDGMIRDALIEGNIVYGNCGGNAHSGGGGAGINCDGICDSIIRNNLIYDNQRSGITLYRGDGGEISTRNVVVNNTVVNGTRSRYAIKIFDASAGNVVFNNILLSRNPDRDSGAIEIGAEGLPGTVCDFNLLDSRCDIGGEKISAAAWRQRTGLDRNSRDLANGEIDRLFVNPGAGDFALRPDSPAVGAGTADLHQGAATYFMPEHDLHGQPRDRQHSPDIGALE